MAALKHRPARATFSLALAALALGSSCDGDLDAFTRAPGAEGGASTGGTPPVQGTGGTTAGAASGGTNSAAGEGAGAGEAGQGGVAGYPPTLLIDDFEDGNTEAAIEGAWWYTTNDTTGTQSFGLEPVTDREGSSSALRNRGQGFTSWGAAVAVDLDVLDVTPYTALSFWIRAEPGSSTEVHIAVLDEFSDHFGSTIQASTSWQRVELRFDELAGLPETPSLVGPEITHVQFFILTLEPFDFWLDDIELVAPAP